MVLAIRGVLPTGEAFQTKYAPKASNGPNLTHFFMGSEGAFCFVTEATLRILPLPEHRIYQGIDFPDLASGIEAIRQMSLKKIMPPCIRLHDRPESVAKYKKVGMQDMGCLLVLIYEGSKEVTQAEWKLCQEIIKNCGGKDVGEQLAINWYEKRFDVSSVIKWNTKPNSLAFTIETAGSWANMEDIYNGMVQDLKEFTDNPHAHFSHFYDTGGSMYFTLYFHLPEKKSAHDHYFSIIDKTLASVVEKGGTVSHHHGIGHAYAHWMEAEHMSAFNVLSKIKNCLDPNSILNMGKLGLKGER